MLTHSCKSPYMMYARRVQESEAAILGEWMLANVRYSVGTLSQGITSSGYDNRRKTFHFAFARGQRSARMQALAHWAL